MEKVNMKLFNNYVYEKRRTGLSDKQIAMSLGMSLKHFHTMLNGEESKQDAPVKKFVKPTIEEKPFPVKNDAVPEPDYGSFAEKVTETE